MKIYLIRTADIEQYKKYARSGAKSRNMQYLMKTTVESAFTNREKAYNTARNINSWAKWKEIADQIYFVEEIITR